MTKLNSEPAFPRRRNWPLLIGMILALLVAFLVIAGPALAPRDPLETHTVSPDQASSTAVWISAAAVSQFV